MNLLSNAMRDAAAGGPPTAINLETLVAGELRRRLRVRLVTAAGMAALVASSVPAFVASTGGHGGGGDTASPWVTAPPASTGPTSPPTAVPTSRPSPAPDTGETGVTTADWANRATTLLAASVPAGVEFAYLGGGGTAPGYGPPFTVELFGETYTADGRGGQLHALLVIDGEAAPADPCQVVGSQHFYTGFEQDCELVVVGDATVRVSTTLGAMPRLAEDPDRLYDFHFASRYGDGWSVHVWETPFVHHYYFDPDGEELPEMLESPVFTRAELAALAASPDLAPSPPRS